MDLTRALTRDVRKVRQVQRRLQTQFERLLPFLPDDERELLMSDFTAANAALATLQGTATAVVAEVQALQAGTDQASIDALTTGMNGVNTQLAALLSPAPPAGEPGAS